jgi:hypothetical protein
MASLPSDLRSQLDRAIQKARDVAEAGARKALEALAVERAAPHAGMSESQKALRRRLRYHARQIGDRRRPDDTHEIDRLIHEVAYEHWHRMLFARFLAENHLLIEPQSGAAITMEECIDLARERGEDPWAMAASFAQSMLPQIFRSGDPTLEVVLPPETRQALQKELSRLPAPVFTGEDALGWTYQFWQTAEKEKVNQRVKSGEKITGKTLPAVTQLFTEPYMVQFLLHNTIGAWHAGKVLDKTQRETATSEHVLRDAVRLSAAGGYAFDYLRFVREPDAGGDGEEGSGPWRPAAGTYDGWPKTAAELKVLDPCCGSGHFLVSAFELLVRLRMDEEGLALRDAIRAVIRDNVSGLELDPRCTQIAAFNVALAAWKLAGAPIELRPMQIACSGIGPEATRAEWISLAQEAAAAGGMATKQNLFGGDETLLSAALRDGLGKLYDLFEKAPELGSLIDPKSISGGASDLFKLDFDTLLPVLDAVLERERADDETIERAVAAKGMADAARILTGPKGGYTLVITNVPYLGRGGQSDDFKGWADKHHPDARNDLATIFVDRMLRWVGARGTVAAVTPQNWLFLTSYGKLRERLLKERAWGLVARLGPRAFETISGHVVNVALPMISGAAATGGHVMGGIDANEAPSPAEKAALLRGDDVAQADPDAKGQVRLVPQAVQLKGQEFRISFEPSIPQKTLAKAASFANGIQTGDRPRHVMSFWEQAQLMSGWRRMQTTVAEPRLYGGLNCLIRWDETDESIPDAPGSVVRGKQAWGRIGVTISAMDSLPAALYSGEIYDENCVVLFPHDLSTDTALWSYCSSAEYPVEVRKVTQALKVRRHLLQVPFDLDYWRKVAAEKYPNGLPEPYSDDPTQWLFHGHPAHAERGTELQVVVARLLGYRWPAELDDEMRLSDAARALIAKSRELDAPGLTDADGIVSLAALRGQAKAADRLRSLLAATYGNAWSAAKERALIQAAAQKHGTRRVADTLEEWLQSAFFEEHCKLFHDRPFIWHVWDGLPEGFNVLVNYHRIAGLGGAGRRTLESITFSYLGDWIERLRAAQRDGREGAEGKLAAAQRLQGELEKILKGEPPYDIFVRWKPLHEQPLGWEPDINDGVRLNIRPFLYAQDVGRKGAGILRYKPNAKWGKDRGKEPESLGPQDDFPWFYGCNPEAKPEHEQDFGAGGAPAGEFDGARWNDLHYSRAAKKAARKRAPTEVNA